MVPTGPVRAPLARSVKRSRDARLPKTDEASTPRVLTARALHAEPQTKEPYALAFCPAPRSEANSLLGTRIPFQVVVLMSLPVARASYRGTRAHLECGGQLKESPLGLVRKESPLGYMKLTHKVEFCCT